MHCVLVHAVLSWLSQVGLGDFVEVYSGEKDTDGNDRPWIMEVTELFEDAQVHLQQESNSDPSR